MDVITAVFALACVGCIVAGAWIVSVPLGLVASGVMFGALAVLSVNVDRKDRK